MRKTFGEKVWSSPYLPKMQKILSVMENIMLLTQKQLDTFYRDGFILVEDLFDSKEMTVALNDMEQIFYGKPYSEYL